MVYLQCNPSIQDSGTIVEEGAEGLYKPEYLLLGSVWIVLNGDRHAVPIRSQQHGCLNNTWKTAMTGNIPVFHKANCHMKNYRLSVAADQEEIHFVYGLTPQ